MAMAAKPHRHDGHYSVIASEAWQSSNPTTRALALDCFATLAMTAEQAEIAMPSAFPLWMLARRSRGTF